MIDSITIRGYKTFKDIKVDLQPINILIGGNGSGKSNFLSAFELLGNAYEGNLCKAVKMAGGVDKILHRGSSETDRVSLIFRDGKTAYSLGLMESRDTLKVENERIGYFSDSKGWIYTSIAKKPGRACIKEI